jgi:hypothetical protein
MGSVRAAGSISYMATTAAAGQRLALLGATALPRLQALGYGFAAVFARVLPQVAVAPSAPRVLGGWGLCRLRPFRPTVACTALIRKHPARGAVNDR